MEIKVPHESSETVKGILEKDISVKDQAKMIYRYSQQVIKRKHGIGRGVMKPKVSEKDIERILLDRFIEDKR